MGGGYGVGDATRDGVGGAGECVGVGVACTNVADGLETGVAPERVAVGIGVSGAIDGVTVGVASRQATPRIRQMARQDTARAWRRATCARQECIVTL